MAVKKKRPWQKRGYAIGLGESIELAVSRGHQEVRMMWIWIRAEWGSIYGPTETDVRLERAKLRKQGHLTYTKTHGWRIS